MKRISTLLKKQSLAVFFFLFMATLANGRMSSPVGVFRVFWNKFEAKLSNENSVVLTWNVTEYNNKSFRVQHSANGMDWENIAEVSSKNSPESMVDYTFTHNNKLSGKQYYRIEELDVDVVATGFSPIRTLMVINEKPVLSIWPNPATSHVLITNNDHANPYTKARVFDLSGKVLAESTINSHSNRVAIGELAPGAYIVQIENEKGEKFGQKIIKQ